MKKILILVLIFLSLAAFYPLEGSSLFDYKVYPRVVTPNKDAYNNCLYIYYKTEGLSVSGAVFNLLGREVGSFQEVDAFYIAPDGTTWDGYLKWQPGSVSSGIYIWRIEVENDKVYTGTVIVAK